MAEAMWTQPVALVNGLVLTPDGTAPSVRFDHRILSVGDRPARGDAVVDLEGRVVVPGLVNAHDHLELNHYGAIKGRDVYDNASQWIADMQPRLMFDDELRERRTKPLGDRLFIGALKNLLAGVTTVAHHNPRYPQIGHRFPVRVVRRYGWAHSFALQGGRAGANGEPAGDVRLRYRSTPADAPFVVHIGEGVDDRAGAELPRLEAIGALEANTIVVHGVALGERDWRDIVRRRAGLVWCPASNAFLFGRTTAVRAFLDIPLAGASGRIALGTDSRLTGSRDLLDEMRAAAASAPLTADELMRMVTTAPADLLRIPDVGRITAGARADLIVIAANGAAGAASLLASRRADVQLVVRDGHPMVADPSFGAVFEARSIQWKPIVVDQSPRIADSGLARSIAQSTIPEPGVTCR